VKLIDFGLSKHFHFSEVMSQQVGSAYYVAPEILHGEYNYKCDMWSMGVILYMLVSGVPPFWGRSDAEIRQRIAKGTYVFPKRQFQHVSAGAVDLIRNLLCVDVNARLDASSALQHPWLKAAAPSPTLQDNSKAEIIGSLRQFTSFSAMRKLMLEVIAFTLNTEQINGLRVIFEAMDEDKSGTLSLEEVKATLHTFDDVGDDEIEAIFNDVNVNHDHSINYNEFIAATMWKRIHLDEERLHQVFDTLDVQHDGFLTTESIQNAVGLDFSADDVASMITECDANGDGRIDYLEFAKLWKVQQIKQAAAGSLAPLHGAAALDHPVDHR